MARNIHSATNRRGDRPNIRSLGGIATATAAAAGNQRPAAAVATAAGFPKSEFAQAELFVFGQSGGSFGREYVECETSRRNGRQLDSAHSTQRNQQNPPAKQQRTTSCGLFPSSHW